LITPRVSKHSQSAARTRRGSRLATNRLVRLPPPDERFGPGALGYRASAVNGSRSSGTRALPERRGLRLRRSLLAQSERPVIAAPALPSWQSASACLTVGCLS